MAILLYALLQQAKVHHERDEEKEEEVFINHT